MLTESFTNWWQSTRSQVETISSYILPRNLPIEVKTITDSLLPGNLMTMARSPLPLHVCQQERSWIVSRALTLSGLQDVPIKFSKIEDKTILKIETEQGRILDGVKTFFGMVERIVQLPDIPIKTETAGSKTFITVELKEGIFCDCDVEIIQAPPTESEDDKLSMRILPSYAFLLETYADISADDVEAIQESKTLITKEFRELTDIEEEEPPADDTVVPKKDSGTLIKEFFELTDAEETFLERKASIRRSARSLRKKNAGTQYLVESTEDLQIIHENMDKLLHPDIDWSHVTYV